MNWYDFIAPIYDRIVNKIYAPNRELAIQSLDLEPGSAVLDIGCGSELNFELIHDALGSEGGLIGVDFSAVCSSGPKKQRGNKVGKTSICFSGMYGYQLGMISHRT